MGSFHCYDNSDVIASLIMAIFHLYLVQLWWQFFYGDVVYAQNWQILTLKYCIDVATYGPRFFSTVLEKFEQLARIFWGKWFTPPPPRQKTCPYAMAKIHTAFLLLLMLTMMWRQKGGWVTCAKRSRETLIQMPSHTFSRRFQTQNHPKYHLRFLRKKTIIRSFFWICYLAEIGYPGVKVENLYCQFFHVSPTGFWRIYYYYYY